MGPIRDLVLSDAVAFAVNENVILGWSTVVSFRRVVLGDSEGDSMVVEIRDGLISCGRKCDVNKNGTINIIDILAQINHILGIVPLTDLWTADWNDDERINILDVLGCVNVILGNVECDTVGSKTQVNPETMGFLKPLKPKSLR